MQRYITIGVSCIFCLVVLPASAGADQLTDTRGLPYKGAFTGYRDHTLNMRVTGMGPPKSTTLDKIRILKIKGFDAFNQAEALAGKKKYAEAVSAYDKALRSVPSDRSWWKTLVAERRYQALAKAGKIDQAMKVWLKMMDADPADKIAQALIPETFAPEDDPANAAALKLLNARLTQLGQDAKNKEYTERLLKLKMKLLEAMGKEEEATAAAEAVTKLDAPAQREGQGEDEKDEKDEEPAPKANQGDLDVLERLVKSGKYDGAIEKLASRMQTLPRNELSESLLLLGKAQWLKYQQSDPKDRTLLLRAGLNLMWVYSAFNDSDSVPEALYLVAEIHRDMGDKTAATLALKELVEQFGGAEDNPWVTKANEILEAE